MGAYHHSQETMATVLAKFQETQRLQEEQYLRFSKELNSINTTLGTIVGVLKDLVNTRRDTVSVHQKKGIWCAIAKDVRTLGIYHRRSTHCRKRWEDLRCWSKKMADAQLGMASQRGRGARRTMTPLMSRILAVACPELDGRLRASQQPQGGEYTLSSADSARITRCLGGGGGQFVPLSQGELGRQGPL
ncbi:hypothetical protein NDU88_000623 [Pleurodeles waltl]|uniref:Myb/SANT-like DNA-binding domain-containing protein n=1 Tax=Pleurodeles waltl TaxID=8319 RepID=A0AAV7URL9_PLEWA|nr:hypothetical protein NDU88_000623 [Pleurodeles waltl]